MGPLISFTKPRFGQINRRISIRRCYRRKVIVSIGDWGCCISWNRKGVFSNGSHWFSGWFRWSEQPEF